MEARTQRRNEGFDVEHRVYLLEADLDRQDSAIAQLSNTIVEVADRIEGKIENKIDDVNKRIYSFMVAVILILVTGLITR